MKDGLTKQERRKAWLYAILISAGMILAGVLVWRVVAAPSAQVALPEENDALLLASEDMDSITIDAVFDPDARSLTATQTMTLRNRTGQTLTQATLRSYSGAYLSQETSPAATEELFTACYGERFSTGGLLLDSASVNGEAVSHAWQDDARTVLTLPLASWQPDEVITVRLAYHVYIPQCQSRFGYHDGIYALGNVFPVAAPWVEGECRTDAYNAIGDPFISECANWTVRLTMPRGYQAAATDYAETVDMGDCAVQTMTAHGVRDFALVISDQWHTAFRMAGDTMIAAYARTEAKARQMAEQAALAMQCYTAHYGPYVYPTLTLCEVDFPYGGMEYPRLAMIASDLTGQDLTYTVAHETAHQWWGVMVGSDGYRQPWQDEALCEYALLDFIGATEGEAAREDAAYHRVEAALRVTVLRGVTPGSPIDYFADLSEYTLVVYHRGAALFTALEKLLSKESMDAFLGRYLESFRYAVATREDLEALASQAAGMDVSALFVDYLDTEMR